MTTKIDNTMQEAWKEFIREYGRAFLSHAVDSWDKNPEMLDEEPYYRHSYDHMKKEVSDPDACYEHGVMMAAGKMFDDPNTSTFSSWGVEGGIFVEKIPFDRILTPKEIFSDESKDWNCCVDWLAVGQYHDDGSDTWAARLWDRKKECEFPQSRFLSDDLGMAVTMAAMTILFKLVDKEGKLLDQPIKR